MNHTHEYRKPRPTSGVEICYCGRFRWTPEYVEKMGGPIVGRPMHFLRDCGICGGLHPLDFDGDCRDDANRYGSAGDYAARNNISFDQIEVRHQDE